MENQQLLPCPFCGETVAIKTGGSAYFQWMTWVECRRCHARSTQMVFGNNGSLRAEDCSYNGREEAVAYVVALWNRREGTKNA